MHRCCCCFYLGELPVAHAILIIFLDQNAPLPLLLLLLLNLTCSGCRQWVNYLLHTQFLSFF
jgi:hypothetical protein